MIELSPKFRIDCSDKLNATLQELRIRGKKHKKAGQEYWHSVSYHPTIPSAVQHWTVLETFEAEDLFDLIKIIKKLDQKINDLMSAREHIV